MTPPETAESKHRELGLTDSEFELICSKLDRDPNGVDDASDGGLACALAVPVADAARAWRSLAVRMRDAAVGAVPT